MIGPCTHAPTAAAAGNRRPAGDLGNQPLSINGEGLGAPIPSYSDGFSGRKSQFPLEVWFLSMLQWMTQTKVYGRIN